MNISELYYLKEKLSSLVSNLLIGEGNAKERLKSNLVLIYRTFALDFPPQYQKEKEKIIWQLTKFGPNFLEDKMILNEYENTLFKIKNSTASKIIKEIGDINFIIEFLIADVKNGTK